MKTELTLPNGSSRSGAQMGRPNVLPDNLEARINLNMEKLRWVDGDYDQFGAYWGGGSGDDVYCAHAQWGIPYGEVFIFVRAKNRMIAKELVREFLPNATFFR